ncbi:MAG: transcriptional repressor [Proteobacteria bacterium]|nr:transcriptional repressor [Pseudomonadota bacterium]
MANLANPAQKMASLKSYMEKKGLKSTNQRDCIAEAFFKTNTHISLDELLKKAKRKTNKIGYATVYRTMKMLAESGLAVQRQFGDGQTRFENLPADGHHDHIICVKCSKIAEFKNEKIEEQQLKSAKELGFTVINHKLELYGYCKKCS